MVPTVRGEWMSEITDWPVVGPLHDDMQFFQFPWNHYHIDGRFLTRRQQQRAANYGYTKIKNSYEKLARACLAYPMQTNDSINRGGFGKPVLMEKKCSIPSLPYWSGATESKAWLAMVDAFAGHICKRGKRGFVCPHQNVALGAVAAIDGVITCPLHGLRIDAESGRVLA